MSAPVEAGRVSAPRAAIRRSMRPLRLTRTASRPLAQHRTTNSSLLHSRLHLHFLLHCRRGLNQLDRLRRRAPRRLICSRTSASLGRRYTQVSFSWKSSYIPFPLRRSPTLCLLTVSPARCSPRRHPRLRALRPLPPRSRSRVGLTRLLCIHLPCHPPGSSRARRPRWGPSREHGRQLSEGDWGQGNAS